MHRTQQTESPPLPQTETRPIRIVSLRYCPSDNRTLSPALPSLHVGLRVDTWPEKRPLREKLYNDLVELKRTAAFARATEVDVRRKRSTTKKKSKLGEFFKTTVGVCQGCLLSPILFKLFLKRIMQETCCDHHTSISIGGRSICNLRFANTKLTGNSNSPEKIWETKEWLKEWTQSLVTPLIKNGNLKQCQNYRTVNLISHPSKIMLRVILFGLKGKQRNCWQKSKQVSDQAGVQWNRSLTVKSSWRSTYTM